jgi:hypothetical protein
MGLREYISKNVNEKSEIIPEKESNTEFREFLTEAFNLNFDSAKSMRSKDEWETFLAYSDKLWRLRKLAFEAGYDLSIRWTASDNPKNGFFDVMDYDLDGVKPIKTLSDISATRTLLLSNYKKK